MVVVLVVASTILMQESPEAVVLGHDTADGTTVSLVRRGNVLSVLVAGDAVSDNLVPLPSNVSSRERELNSGKWLVLAFNPRGTRDVRSVFVASGVASSLKAKGFKVGIRPHTNRSDIEKWCEGCLSETLPGSPLWLVLRDGKLVAADEGEMTPDGIHALIDGKKPAN